MDSILNILPGNWGSTIKRVLLIITLIIIIPIVFVIGIITMKLLKNFLLVLSTTNNRSGQFCLNNDKSVNYKCAWFPTIWETRTMVQT